ncbi:hypothetical protein GL174_09420 [Sphingobium sp. CAP-1]|nr:hypothetical protein GL174_09420 [Sphingobium sp. CAP-1]
MRDERDLDQEPGLFDRWRARLAQALLREPSVVLIERDADALFPIRDRDDALRPACETMR